MSDENIVQRWNNGTAEWETIPGEWDLNDAIERAEEESRRGHPARVLQVRRFPAYPVGRD